MKKLLIAMLAVVGLWACTSQDEPAAAVVDDSATAETVLPATRTPEEARACAIDAFSRFYGMSRAITPIKDVRCVTAKREARSAAGDTLYYIVNAEDNGGYAIISADREMVPVLAVTESGNIDDPENVDNPGVEDFLDDLHYLSFPPSTDKKPINDSLTTIRPNPWWSGSGDNGENPNPVPQYRTEVTIHNDEVAPRAPYRWGQNFPEGAYFSNGVAGCANTAALLLLSYFEVPKWFTFINSGYKTVDWALIKSHKYSLGEGATYDLCGGIDHASHRVIADFCYTLGILNNSEPKDKEKKTSTKLENVHKTLVSFRTLGFNPREIVSGKPNAKNHLGDGIIYVGAHSGKDGHAFIIDGYKSTTTTTTTYKREPGATSWDVIDRKVEIETYNHINWGWCGKDNGYFAVDVFRPDGGKEYDDGFRYTHDSDFTKNFKYFVVTKQ